MIKKLYWQNQQDLDALKSEIVANHVVISSTDTVYGFLGNITQESFNSICKLKGIAQARPFLILVSHQDLLSKIANFVDISSISGKTLKFIESCWPGPVTFIFKSKQASLVGQVGSSLDFLSGGRETIAIRCPEHDGLQAILAHFDGLFSTSANKTGMPTPVKFSDIDKGLLNQDLVGQDLVNPVNYVILDSQESANAQEINSQASTIIDLSCSDCTQDFPFSIVRDGSFSVEELHEVYRKLG